MEERPKAKWLLAGHATIKRGLTLALIFSRIGTASLRRTRMSYASR